MRKWIVKKTCHWCDSTCKVVSVDDDARQVSLHCPKCARTFSVDVSDFLDYRACQDCGHVRRVTVTFYTHAANAADRLVEHRASCCTACQYDRAALSHLRSYQQLKKKGEALREKQRARTARELGLKEGGLT